MPGDTNKPFGLNLSKRGAELLLKGLKSLPLEEQNEPIGRSLTRDLSIINMLFIKRMEEEKKSKSKK